MFKKKLKFPVLVLLVLILFPSIYALTITDTTFHSSVSNYTIFVDSITLDNVTVTNLTIEFYNLTSIGSNFTNTNLTYDARADFYGLAINLTIYNVNTSTTLFTSSASNQDYNATFTSGQILRINNASVTSTETHLEQACGNMMGSIFTALSFLSLIVLLGIGSIIIVTIKNPGSFDFSAFDKLPQLAIGILGFGVLIVIIILIINSAC